MSKTIWCFIIGDIETWPVKIDFAETVAHLKKEIRQDNPNLNAPGVALYRAMVDESINKQRENRMNELNRLCQDLKEYKELDEQQLLGEIFGEVPQGKICYALVRTPDGESIESRVSGHVVVSPLHGSLRRSSREMAAVTTPPPSGLAFGQYSIIRS